MQSPHSNQRPFHLLHVKIETPSTSKAISSGVQYQQQQKQHHQQQQQQQHQQQQQQQQPHNHHHQPPSSERQQSSDAHTPVHSIVKIYRSDDTLYTTIPPAKLKVSSSSSLMGGTKVIAGTSKLSSKMTSTSSPSVNPQPTFPTVITTNIPMFAANVPSTSTMAVAPFFKITSPNVVSSQIPSSSSEATYTTSIPVGMVSSPNVINYSIPRTVATKEGKEKQEKENEEKPNEEEENEDEENQEEEIEEENQEEEIEEENQDEENEENQEEKNEENPNEKIEKEEEEDLRKKENGEKGEEEEQEEEQDEEQDEEEEVVEEEVVEEVEEEEQEEKEEEEDEDEEEGSEVNKRKRQRRCGCIYEPPQEKLSVENVKSKHPWTYPTNRPTSPYATLSPLLSPPASAPPSFSTGSPPHPFPPSPSPPPPPPPSPSVLPLSPSPSCSPVNQNPARRGGKPIRAPTPSPDRKKPQQSQPKKKKCIKKKKSHFDINRNNNSINNNNKNKRKRNLKKNSVLQPYEDYSHQTAASPNLQDDDVRPRTPHHNYYYNYNTYYYHGNKYGSDKYRKNRYTSKTKLIENFLSRRGHGFYLQHRYIVIANESCVHLFSYNPNRLKYLIGVRHKVHNHLEYIYNVSIVVPDQNCHTLVPIVITSLSSSSSSFSLMSCVDEIIKMLY